MNKNILIVIFLSTILILASCDNMQDVDNDTQKPINEIKKQTVTLASIFCEENGGEVKIITNEDSSQTGYCILDDGTECEEWAYYNGECSEGKEDAPVKDQVTEKKEKIPLKVMAPTIDKTSIGEVAKTQLLSLNRWTDGKVTMDMPEGWNVFTGGKCSTKSILSRDSNNELKQVFYFSQAGPVYINQEQKEWEQDYMAMGGSPMLWSDSPMVDPLTSENYLMNFGELVSGNIFQQAFPQAPIITDVKVISNEDIANKPSFAKDLKLIRAEFKQNGNQGEGYFYILTAEGNIGEGMGYGMMFIGITAPKGLLDLLTPSLKKSLESYTISQEYVDACIKANDKAAAGALKAGKILSETSNTIMEAWDNKLESEGRMSAKQSDAILGSSRLYDPDSNKVYEVTPEFYDHYQVHGDEFEMNNLQELSDDQWGYAPLNGGAHIR